jgi:hypothetical protein
MVYAEITGRYMVMHDNLFDLTPPPHLHMAALEALSKTKASRLDQSSGWINSTFDSQGVAPSRHHTRLYTYFGDSVTGTSVMLSTGSLLSSAALRTAASLGPS